jgi:hypothetical protein
MQSRRELYDTIGYHDYEALDGTIARSVLPGLLQPPGRPEPPGLLEPPGRPAPPA